MSRARKFCFSQNLYVERLQVGIDSFFRKMRGLTYMSPAHPVRTIGTSEIDSVVILCCMGERHVHGCLCTFGAMQCVQLPTVSSSQQCQNRWDVRSSIAYHASNS